VVLTTVVYMKEKNDLNEIPLRRIDKIDTMEDLAAHPRGWWCTGTE
jgi:hypothetical protein